MKHLVVIPLLLASAMASAIVVRHDVPDSMYLAPDAALPALVDLPHEGHGVLIAPQWVLTAAHATQWHPITEVMLNGDCLKAEEVFVHPGYKQLPDGLAAHNPEGAIRFLAGLDDIALIKLAEPVTNVTPIALYEGHTELGKTVVLFGKGATGNGKAGQVDGANRTQLRRAENVISAVEERALVYTFDSGSSALPLEGMLGNGDSGGPVLLYNNGHWELLGLARGRLSTSPPGFYGQQSHQVRVSYYLEWIRATMGGTSSGRKA
ncbi:S1 family peptidase [Luteimonas soli]|uniref:S1 family peptidase n=1 Tax=Luteimonas soli TaxID=1648966 RepID=A0ABV7XIH4_9GAMM